MYHINGSGRSARRVSRQAAGDTACIPFGVSPHLAAHDIESIRENRSAALKLQQLLLISHIPYKFAAALCKNGLHGVKHPKADCAAKPDRAGIRQHRSEE